MAIFSTSPPLNKSAIIHFAVSGGHYPKNVFQGIDGFPILLLADLVLRLSGPFGTVELPVRDYEQRGRVGEERKGKEEAGNLLLVCFTLVCQDINWQ